jgi:hypothetical protein
MIFTRFGSPINILSIKDQTVRYTYADENDSRVHETSIMNLKADGGLDEIFKAGKVK